MSLVTRHDRLDGVVEVAWPLLFGAVEGRGGVVAPGSLGLSYELLIGKAELCRHGGVAPALILSSLPFLPLSFSPLPFITFSKWTLTASVESLMTPGLWTQLPVTVK